MDMVVAAPSAELANFADASMVLDLSARRAALLRRRRAGAVREWLGAVVVGGVAIWMAGMALIALVAR